jgi:hypothetical protein
VTKGLIALTPEIDCDQTAMGLPPTASAVSKLSLVKRGRLGRISEIALYPFGDKAWYVCITLYNTYIN